MKIISESTQELHTHIHTFRVNDGPVYSAGPTFMDDIEFVVDTVIIKWHHGSSERLVTIEGYRKRFGYMNRGYRHHRSFPDDKPNWLKPFVDKTLQTR